MIFCGTLMTGKRSLRWVGRSCNGPQSITLGTPNISCLGIVAVASLAPHFSHRICARARGCHPIDCRYAPVAQRIEHRSSEPRVGGLNPSGRASLGPQAAWSAWRDFVRRYPIVTNANQKGATYSATRVSSPSHSIPVTTIRNANTTQFASGAPGMR